MWAPIRTAGKVETRAPDGGRLGGKICRLFHGEWLLLWWSGYLAPLRLHCCLWDRLVCISAFASSYLYLGFLICLDGNVDVVAPGIDKWALVLSILLPYIFGF